MLSYEEALAVVTGAANSEQTEVETVALEQSAGRWLATSQRALIDVPGYDNSAMDGFAVRCADVEAGRPLYISARIAAGEQATALEPGTVARVFTGAAIPAGADAVVMQENATISERSAVINQQPDPGQHIRRAGEDISSGAVVVERGVCLSPADLGMMASVGIDSIPCYRPLKVGFFSTGDELRNPGESLAPGQIYNSNRYFLGANIRQLGAQAVDLGRCPDSLQETVAFIESALRQADCVISTGGMSVGEEDHVRTALEQLGEIDFWKVAIKPGKPLAMATIRGKRLFGLPGNPVSSFVTFQLFVRPWLLKQAGAASWQNRKLVARAGFTLENKGQRLDFLRGSLAQDENHELLVGKYPSQGSGVLSSLARSNVLVPVAPGQIVKPGDWVEVVVLSPNGLVLADSL